MTALLRSIRDCCQNCLGSTADRLRTLISRPRRREQPEQRVGRIQTFEVGILKKAGFERRHNFDYPSNPILDGYEMRGEFPEEKGT